MLRINNWEIDNKSRFTSDIRDGLSLDRRKRDGVVVTWGIEPLDIDRFLELAILVERTLVRVRSRRHIERQYCELKDLGAHRLGFEANGQVFCLVTRSFYRTTLYLHSARKT
jgi:hypothetical protein